MAQSYNGSMLMLCMRRRRAEAENDFYIMVIIPIGLSMRDTSQRGSESLMVDVCHANMPTLSTLLISSRRVKEIDRLMRQGATSVAYRLEYRLTQLYHSCICRNQLRECSCWSLSPGYRLRETIAERTDKTLQYSRESRMTVSLFRVTSALYARESKMTVRNTFVLLDTSPNRSVVSATSVSLPGH